MEKSVLVDRLRVSHGQEYCVLNPWTTIFVHYPLIDAYNLTYCAAADDKRLPIADRSRVHCWLKAMDQELDKAGDVLGITEENQPRAHPESARSAAG